MWFSRAEALQWIPDKLDAGRARRLPDALVARIVCLHLLDSVSGLLPERFQSQDLGASWIRPQIVMRDDSHLQLRITGRTLAHALRREIGPSANRVETRLLGYATFNIVSQSFDRFELVALGRCTEFLGPAGEYSNDSREIGFALTLAAAGQPRTPPFFLHRYEVDWVEARGLHGTPPAAAIRSE